MTTMTELDDIIAQASGPQREALEANMDQLVTDLLRLEQQHIVFFGAPYVPTSVAKMHKKMGWTQ